MAAVKGKPGPKPGYRQSPEHVAKRVMRGAANPRWLGDDVSTAGGRSRALRLYPPAPCEQCGEPNAERHHVDRNTANNGASNIQMLCPACHRRAHAPLIADLARGASDRAPLLIEAAAAARRDRAECKRGHPLSGENLYVTKSNKRVCKSCRALHKAAYRARQGTSQ